MEKRMSFLTSQFRAETVEGKPVIEGYFIKYGVETNLYDDVYEEVDAMSVVRSLKENDIRSLFNHDTSLVLGRTGNNTLTLKSDDIGLWGRIEVNEEDVQAMSAYARVKRGDVPGCSFGFYPTKQERQKREGGGEKYILREMDLFEVSPCVFPQYTQTEISARKQDIAAMKREKLETKKQLLKERLKK
ncbi:MAG: HK97 family phage prohead protease [Anaerotignaceae bacterium]